MADDMTLASTACSQFEALLEDYVESGLDTADAKRSEVHMRECGACREAFEGARMSAQLFRAAAPAGMAPDPGFSRMVMARIRVVESELSAESAGFWQSLVTLGWRFAATAALALVALVAYDAGSARHAQPNQVAIRPMQATDFLFASDPAQPPANRDEVLIMVAETGHGTN
ncbi:MAG TPA: zf-HC2 domain-containing protein [Candidatus Dormibacteraeota bacterium]|nr:zf-HC2 domain-containing protein [Candidatus Dormibacteraeota bacterium]